MFVGTWDKAGEKPIAVTGDAGRWSHRTVVSVKSQQYHESRTPYGAFTNLTIAISSIESFIGDYGVGGSAAEKVEE